jgi:hypothetical protein
MPASTFDHLLYVDLTRHIAQPVMASVGRRTTKM